ACPTWAPPSLRATSSWAPPTSSNTSSGSSKDNKEPSSPPSPSIHHQTSSSSGLQSSYTIRAATDHLHMQPPSEEHHHPSPRLHQSHLSSGAPTRP
ncbi:unnamed protein product, partial [Adineta steineri]